MKLEITTLENKIGENTEILTEENLREIISIEEKKKDNFDRVTKEKNKKKNENDKNKKEIEDLKNEHIEKYENIKDENSLLKEINDRQEKISNYESEIKTHTSNLEKINEYNNYSKALEKYREFKNKITDLENKEKEDRKKYDASVLLKEKILEAESIAILNIIETINNHSQVYLDYFFPDNPIIVKLQSFKETKKDNKPQIIILIDYKGNETDLASLSGGELSRVVLAFTLALSEIFNSPILLLDESTASLDQDSTTIVFDAIKENFKNKLVLIVAHQVVLGIFDNIIKIA
jgi:DNA repair exonuclease SbcCD ATPase subunit